MVMVKHRLVFFSSQLLVTAAAGFMFWWSAVERWVEMQVWFLQMRMIDLCGFGRVWGGLVGDITKETCRELRKLWAELEVFRFDVYNSL
ncbi:hypothetical protein RchiOBHm_Chr2g0088521 [Rosa chinensis]|uniref:Uncharacterized protein n=1 Tax=Rosa chinensis TaxID=74649 RepID=A0A2P6RIY8_ROSCH|nr:hypothetical protein RchiOBHm_Chr2g0088521 [Rosa chinensis]